MLPMLLSGDDDVVVLDPPEDLREVLLSLKGDRCDVLPCQARRATGFCCGRHRPGLTAGAGLSNRRYGGLSIQRNAGIPVESVDKAEQLDALPAQGPVALLPVGTWRTAAGGAVLAPIASSRVYVRVSGPLPGPFRRRRDLRACDIVEVGRELD